MVCEGLGVGCKVANKCLPSHRCKAALVTYGVHKSTRTMPNMSERVGVQCMYGPYVEICMCVRPVNLWSKIGWTYKVQGSVLSGSLSPLV